MKKLEFQGLTFFLVYSVENRGDYGKIPAENKQKVSCVKQHHEEWAGLDIS